MPVVNNISKNLDKIAKMYPNHLGSAVYHEAQIEMTEAKRRTPVSPLPARKGVVPGTLRASGQVSEPEFKGKKVEVTLSFGGEGSGAEEYAVVQHENLEYFHTTGQAKYLESVLNESASSMGRRIAARAHLDKLPKVI